ncbi:hypothetical protein FQA39_LY07093 [Lamprigera yunnana]|nr:hypothetical protein FQA39_LY07093 [Lamprigera yunnana]
MEESVTVNTTEREENNPANNEHFDSNTTIPGNLGTPRQSIHLILDGKFFRIKKSDEDNVSAECVRCNKIIKGKFDAITNFRTHLKALNLPIFRDIQFTINAYKKIITTFQLRHLKFCFTLVTVLLDSLQKRFGDYLSLSPKVNDVILASMTHPFFKLRWAPKDNRNQLKKLLLNEIDRWSKSTNSLNTNGEADKNFALDRTNCEDYFMFDTHISNGRTNNLQLQVLQYFENGSVDLSMLK